MKKDKEKTKLTFQEKAIKEIRGYAEAIVIALIITTFIFTTVGVAGSSMDPTFYGGSSGKIIDSLLTGDRLFVPKYETWLRRAKLLDGYKRGSVIIFREKADSPCRRGRRAFLVKRLIGLPGDEVLVENGKVFINGTELDQGFITDKGGRLGGRDTAGTIKVPEGEYFVLGDNRAHSCDSRFFGTIPFMSIAGRASAVIWPPIRKGASNWRAVKIPDSFKDIPDTP